MQISSKINYEFDLPATIIFDDIMYQLMFWSKSLGVQRILANVGVNPINYKRDWRETSVSFVQKKPNIFRIVNKEESEGFQCLVVK